MAKQYPEFVRLSPEAFKAEVKQRGWSYRALAQYWDMSEVRVSQIARDADRPHYYDDAVRGLPYVDENTRK